MRTSNKIQMEHPRRMTVFYALGILFFNGVVSGYSVPTTRSHSPAITGLRSMARVEIHSLVIDFIMASNGKVKISIVISSG
jgi:hypothetical protein